MSLMKLPKIGLGTWKLKIKEAKFSTIEAMKIGYRFIDTAQSYGNESGLGEGLQEIFESGIVKRKDTIIATKIHPIKVRPKLTLKSALKSLKKLKLDYIDILYVHYPAFVLGYSHKKTLRAFSQLVDEGKIKNIGVSNFTPQMIEEAQEACDKPIFANQIENHPYLQQKTMQQFLREKKINLISFSPLGRGKVLNNAIIKEIAERNKISVAQVCLVWLMNKGAIPIPKATSLNHLKENFAACNLQLSEEDNQKIDEISIKRRFVHPPVVSPKEWKK